MIIGDNVSLHRLFGDLTHQRHEGFDFRCRVQVIVTLIAARILLEPGFVVASMQAEITDRGGDLRGGLQRIADNRLVDVAESDLISL